MSYDIIKAPCGLSYRKHLDGRKKPYELIGTFVYYSKFFDKYVMLEDGYDSDGATWACDIISCGWWVHDKLCDEGCWSDGTKVSNLKASLVLSMILWSEGRYVRTVRWFFATLFFGGGEARKNGVFKLKDKILSSVSKIKDK